MQNSNRYSWFKNKEQFQFDTKGIELKLDSLKIVLLDKAKQFSVNAKDKKYNITYLAKVKDTQNKLRYFGISEIHNKLFVVRLDSNNNYSPDSIYRKSDFLSLCTMINRKLK